MSREKRDGGVAEELRARSIRVREDWAARCAETMQEHGRTDVYEEWLATDLRETSMGGEWPLESGRFQRTIHFQVRRGE